MWCKSIRPTNIGTFSFFHHSELTRSFVALSFCLGWRLDTHSILAWFLGLCYLFLTSISFNHRYDV